MTKNNDLSREFAELTAILYILCDFLRDMYVIQTGIYEPSRLREIILKLQALALEWFVIIKSSGFTRYGLLESFLKLTDSFMDEASYYVDHFDYGGTEVLDYFKEKMKPIWDELTVKIPKLSQFLQHESNGFSANEDFARIKYSDYEIVSTLVGFKNMRDLYEYIAPHTESMLQNANANNICIFKEIIDKKKMSEFSFSAQGFSSSDIRATLSPLRRDKYLVYVDSERTFELTDAGRKVLPKLLESIQNKQKIDWENITLRDLLAVPIKYWVVFFGLILALFQLTIKISEKL